MGCSRLLGARNGPRGRQTTIQDEKPVLGKGSGPRGPRIEKIKTSDVWVLARWHPDRNPESVELSTAVFQHIQQRKAQVLAA